MRYRWLLLALVVIASADWAALLMLGQPADRQPYAGMPLHEQIFPALGLSQTSVLAAWVALGGGWASWRWLGLTVAILTWGRMLGDAMLAPDASPIWTLRLLLQSGFVLLALCAARARGLRLTATSAGDRPSSDAREPSNRQFSLAYLLTWVTCAAVTLGLLKYRFDDGRFAPSTALVMQITLLSAGQAIAALATLWAAWGTYRPLVRFALVVLACGAATGLGCAQRQTPLNSLPAYFLFCLMESALLLGQLWLFRLAGCRLARD